MLIKNLLLISFFYMLFEALIFYFNQKNHSNICFWMVEIFFIHFFLNRQTKTKLFRHQILSFIIILISGFGIRLILAFLPQCEFGKIDPEDPSHYKDVPEFAKKIVKEAIIKNNVNWGKLCRNSFKITEKFDSFQIILIIATIGYLIGFFLHSYSVVNIRYLINNKYISPYFIIFFIGLIGLISSLIGLIISSSISCSKSNFNKEICPVITTKNSSIYYFDNFKKYITNLNETIHNKKSNSTQKKPAYKDNTRKSYLAIIEIIFSIIILPTAGFFKANFDFYIIKELSVFHIIIPEGLSLFIKDLILIVFILSKKTIDDIQLKQIIFKSISNIIVLIGLCIYLELIELNFCRFNKDIKKKLPKGP